MEGYKSYPYKKIRGGPLFQIPVFESVVILCTLFFLLKGFFGGVVAVQSDKNMADPAERTYLTTYSKQVGSVYQRGF